jgi:hypothetical protein
MGSDRQHQELVAALRSFDTERDIVVELQTGNAKDT